ncbi:DUF6247 family protein [Rhizohabitans arisaemae]|uniref:DUF6247 family protein n=1 Tax=Rhizohabitans arisaemae TaxID=2720610 RepID=UPI0024B09DBF|nr:DUF6247 family protein [Rhizohabitans arisaemae]
MEVILVMHSAAATPSDERESLPQLILSRLHDPAQRESFLSEYRSALQPAVDPWRFHLLEQVLHQWDLRSQAYLRDGYREVVKAAATDAETEGTSPDEPVPGRRSVGRSR